MDRPVVEAIVVDARSSEWEVRHGRTALGCPIKTRGCLLRFGTHNRFLRSRHMPGDNRNRRILERPMERLGTTQEHSTHTSLSQSRLEILAGLTWK